jgi:hypothetical protein
MAHNCKEHSVQLGGIESRIFYCKIPECDCGADCEGCDLRGLDAITALANEIVKLEKWVDRYDTSERNKSFLRSIGINNY